MTINIVSPALVVTPLSQATDYARLLLEESIADGTITPMETMLKGYLMLLPEGRAETGQLIECHKSDTMLREFQPFCRWSPSLTS